MCWSCNVWWRWIAKTRLPLYRLLPTVACLMKAVVVTALWIEWDVIPGGTGLLQTLWCLLGDASFDGVTYGWTGHPLTLVGVDMEINIVSVFLKKLVPCKWYFRALLTSRVCQAFSFGCLGFGQNDDRYSSWDLWNAELTLGDERGIRSKNHIVFMEHAKVAYFRHPPGRGDGNKEQSLNS